MLRPWIPLDQALEREMKWYEKCPSDGKYPRCVTVTFLDGKFDRLANRKDSIPAMQAATGILSYLAYYRYRRTHPAWALTRARTFADYILDDASTPDAGVWPKFPRSTGKAGAVPQPDDCGSQADRPFEIEPDKGALFAYSLLELFAATKDARYFSRALGIAETLRMRMRPGDADHSPWPFRADFRTGDGRGDVGANQGYALALFAELESSGRSEFSAPRAALWNWIKTFQLPSAKKDGKLWVNFFEDYDLAGNRNSWSALNLARLLLQRRERLDRDWLTDSRTLIDFATQHFVTIRQGVPVCGEQDDDKDPWGGALSTYGATLALYAKATGNLGYENLAFQALNFAMYAVDTDGCPGQTAKYAVRGGWQEDAHTDVVHNLVEALEAFPSRGK